MNEIHVRTNKGEYNPGENIYGVVYLRILSPTGGRGVAVSFHGYEKFEYKYKSTDEDQPSSYKAKKDYVCHNYVVLYEAEDTLGFGNWLYPFKIPLPTDIPGSFSAEDETNALSWQASVEYRLYVKVIDASHSLSVCQGVVIYQSPPAYCANQSMPVAIHVAHMVRQLFIYKQNVHVVARLHEHVHRTGDVLKLRVIITNNSSIAVHSLTIKLIRRIRLICKMQERIREDENVVFMGDHEDLIKIRLDNNCVGREQQINMKNFPTGLDNIQIPLRETDSSPVCPSVRGFHVKCEYVVTINVVLNNGSSFDVDVPVPVITAEKNHEYKQWKAPMWVAEEDVQIQHSDSIFGVPENVLRSEAFSSLPGFQPL